MFSRSIALDLTRGIFTGSSLMTEARRTLIEKERQTAQAKRRFLKRIRSAPDRGTRGKVEWTRDELYER
jgi:hypothetical protein